jgi:hypothetical protein
MGMVMVDPGVLIAEFGDAAAKVGIEGWPCQLRGGAHRWPGRRPAHAVGAKDRSTSRAARIRVAAGAARGTSAGHASTSGWRRTGGLFLGRQRRLVRGSDQPPPPGAGPGVLLGVLRAQAGHAAPQMVVTSNAASWSQQIPQGGISMMDFVGLRPMVMLSFHSIDSRPPFYHGRTPLNCCGAIVRISGKWPEMDQV